MAANGSRTDYDVLVVGAGVGGMESALTLGDMGFKVLVVEKEPSVGGRMVLLSKVFPTLDCASCISTPKMAAVNNHPNIRPLVYSEVDDITPRAEGGFLVHLTRKPTFVDAAKCTGCALCEAACTVAVPDEFNYDLAARRAAHIAFPQAVPKKAVITRRGTSPCSFVCPAGVKPHGYISLVRSGQYDQAFRQHLEDAPLVGVLSRACYAPCEEQCARAEIEGTVPIRGIKRFVADRYYEAHPTPEYGLPKERCGKSCAIVGSGPAGLSAAFFLARTGYDVTIFEAEAEPGGMMRWGIPSYRLPKEVLERDIQNVTALGVRIVTDRRIASLDTLREYDVVFLALGTWEHRPLGVPGEELPGVVPALAFLRASREGRPISLGEEIVVIGGGDVAVDSVRTALRQAPGARVTLVYRRGREEMPAHWEEVEFAEAEGTRFVFQKAPLGIVGQDHVEGIVVQSMELGPPDASGRRRPVPVPGSEATIACDTVIVAVGLRADPHSFQEVLARGPDGTIVADPETLATSIPRVFVGGDVVTGPMTIPAAIGQGKRAAFYIDRFLKGQTIDSVRFDERLPMADRDTVVAHAKEDGSVRPPVAVVRAPVEVRLRSFSELGQTMTEEEARYSANRCLDCGVCSECRECVAICLAKAIDLDMRAQHETVTVGSVALATGFSPFDAREKPALGYGRFPNVITGVQMDRILAPTRPFNAVVRPSDGKSPTNVAFVLCTGSRDEQVGNRLCSRVCCMYSMKQAQLLMGAVPLAEVTIYYIDIRAFGKGYEEFFQQTKGMSVCFTKGKVSRIEETDSNDLIVHYEDIEGDGGPKQARHDLVVLAVGLLPNQGAFRLFPQGGLAKDSYSYVRETNEELEPGQTSLPGVFVIGSATAVRDIPDTIVHSEAASAQIAAYLKKTGAKA
jgi:heterodisulfide reductase subunit A-like polyferredoxin